MTDVHLGPEHARLIRRLDGLRPLDAADRAVLAELPLRLKTFNAGVDVVEQGATPTECCFVLEGFVARFAFTHTGGRQIVSFHVPGDLPDRDGLHLSQLDYAIGAISRANIAFIPHSALARAAGSHPNVAVALWRDGVIDANIFRQWIVNIGRRGARERMAHLICEVFTRLEFLGLVHENQFTFPVTQAQLGDALGISAVHVNRILQDLRSEGLIGWRSSNVTIHRFDALRQIADFDPEYLALKPVHSER